MDRDRKEPTPEAAPLTPAPFWRDWRVGDRVIVRYRLAPPTRAVETPERAGGAHGDRADGPSLTDALGELLAVDDGGVTVRTRRGDVAIPGPAISLGKRVPPAPPRRPGRAGGQPQVKS